MTQSVVAALVSPGGAMSDDSDGSLKELRHTPAGWALEQEMEIAAEIYGPEPKGLRTPPSELSDEELLERYKSLMGFDLKWET
jgi:hypothetical protein